MKNIIVFLIIALVLLGGCAREDVDSAKESKGATTNKDEIWPKTEAFLNGEKYEFDDTNWVYYEIEDSDIGKNVQVNISCEKDAYPLGETCYMSILPLLQTYCGDNFSVSCGSGDDTILYLVINGAIVNADSPTIPTESASGDCESKAAEFYSACESFLKKSGLSPSEIPSEEPKAEEGFSQEQPQGENAQGAEQEGDSDIDYYQKGQELGENLNEELDSIDWEENYEKAEEAGKKAAEWLNKLVE